MNISLILIAKLGDLRGILPLSQKPVELVSLFFSVLEEPGITPKFSFLQIVPLVARLFLYVMLYCRKLYKKAVSVTIISAFSDSNNKCFLRTRETVESILKTYLETQVLLR